MFFLDASSHLYMSECPSVRRSVRPSVRPCVTRFFYTPKMSRSLYENHWGSPTLTLLNVFREKENQGTDGQSEDAFEYGR